MYVCICEGLTDKQLKQAIDKDGIRSCQQLRTCLGAGGQCGKCNQQLKAMLQCQSQNEQLATL